MFYFLSLNRVKGSRSVRRGVVIVAKQHISRLFLNRILLTRTVISNIYMRMKTNDSNGRRMALTEKHAERTERRLVRNWRAPRVLNMASEVAGLVNGNDRAAAEGAEAMRRGVVDQVRSSLEFLFCSRPPSCLLFFFVFFSSSTTC